MADRVRAIDVTGEENERPERREAALKAADNMPTRLSVAGSYGRKENPSQTLEIACLAEEKRAWSRPFS
jgi:hypothetical protein